MDSQYIAVYKVHEFISGGPPSVSSLNDRIFAQKVLYLANAVGVHCGDYIWNWYKKGPYSPALTRTLYLYADSEHVMMSSFSLREDISRALTPIRTLVQAKPRELSKTAWVELLASIHFLYHESSRYQDLTRLVDELRRRKPQYTNENVVNAYRCLEEIGLFVDVSMLAL